MAIAPFPHHYQVQLDGDARLSSGSRPAIPGGFPPQFGGDELHWSPEELLLGAASLCLMTTFQSFAKREALAIMSYRCGAEGTLDKTKTGLAFTSIVLSVEVSVESGSEERAQRVIETAKKQCIIANALKCPVELKVTIAGSPAPDR